MASPTGASLKMPQIHDATSARGDSRALVNKFGPDQSQAESQTEGRRKFDWDSLLLVLAIIALALPFIIIPFLPTN